MTGSGIVLSALRDLYKGTVVVFGTPAEESTGRKVDLTDAGAFDDVDAAFQAHLFATDNLEGRALAMDAAEFVFQGRAAHAASNPQDGVNALDAVMLTFTGINYLRQQLTDDVRIHGIVTEGGEAPNIIPDHCRALFYVRAAKKRIYEETFEKVQNCARGAALMTGAELTIEYPENAYYDLIENQVLAERATAHMTELGFDIHGEEDNPGSTDIGNVSHACPTLYMNVGVADGKVQPHEEGFVAVANGEEARRKLLMTVECWARMALDVFNEPDLRRRAREEFETEK
jgi:amidohydrolase